MIEFVLCYIRNCSIGNVVKIVDECGARLFE